MVKLIHGFDQNILFFFCLFVFCKMYCILVVFFSTATATHIFSFSHFTSLLCPIYCWKSQIDLNYNAPICIIVNQLPPIIAETVELILIILPPFIVLLHPIISIQVISYLGA